MRTRYSKSSEDIVPESRRFAREDDELLDQQQRSAQVLIEAGKPRSTCVLCETSLGPAAPFPHRDLSYLCCSVCGHIQTQLEPPPGYPSQTGNGLAFSDVYTALPPEAYLSRTQRVYTPKLDWALDEMGHAGVPREEALHRQWLELGAGAGYFVHALQQAGARSATGLEQSAELVRIANERLPDSPVVAHSGSLAEAVDQHSADVYVAFFVLEHLQDACELWRALSRCPEGTFLLLAVPVFGLATLVEGAVPNHAARSLDGSLHTQIYTDQSLSHACKTAGYELLAEWLFGQDAVDIKRMILKQLQPGYPPELLATIEERLADLQDPLQGAVDRCRLSDARHILAVKSDAQA